MELSQQLIQKVKNYKVPRASVEPLRGAPILFLVGVTGAGKNTVQQRLMERHPDDYHSIVSHTTRAPRTNNGVPERDGIDYHFVDFETMDKMLDGGAFIEANIVHFTNVYGTSVAEIAAAEAEGKIAVTDIEVQGVEQYVSLGMNVKPVFLLPPDYETWQKRLQARHSGFMQTDDLRNRMLTAVMELEHAMSTHYFFIVINDDLDEAVELVNDIAHGVRVDPHYRKAMGVADKFLATMRTELQKI